MSAMDTRPPASSEGVCTLPAPSTVQGQHRLASTPGQSPRKAAAITQAQKQALIDNLQLEITERARKLRAQCALQAQGLRSRLELRVNRIPHAVRKRKVQDLLDEHTEKVVPKPAAPMPAGMATSGDQAPPRKVLKRQDDPIPGQEDKENEPSQPLLPTNPVHGIPNPKKRTKTAAASANTKATRTASRAKPVPFAVLSPKSHNSRTLPRSPFKAPEKPATGCSNTLNKAPASRAASRTTCRKGGGKAMVKPVDPEAEANTSGTSVSSARTTVVTKPAALKNPSRTAKAAPARKGTTAKKVTASTATKKENVPPAPSTAGGRSLRKRG